MRPGAAASAAAAAAADALFLLALALVVVVAEATEAARTVSGTLSERAHRRLPLPQPPPLLHCKRSPEERQQREIRSATAVDCGRSPVEKMLNLDKLRLDVNQTIFADDVSLSLSYNSSVLQQLDGISLEMRLEKSILGMPFKLPCLPSKKHPAVLVGSCTYKDLCSVLPSSKCREPPSERSLPCSCTKIERQSRGKTRMLTLFLPSELVTAYLNLSNGDYTMKLELVHVKTMRVLGCIQAKWTLAARRKNAASVRGSGDSKRRSRPFGN